MTHFSSLYDAIDMAGVDLLIDGIDDALNDLELDAEIMLEGCSWITEAPRAGLCAVEWIVGDRYSRVNNVAVGYGWFGIDIAGSGVVVYLRLTDSPEDFMED